MPKRRRFCSVSISAKAVALRLLGHAAPVGAGPFLRALRASVASFLVGLALPAGAAPRAAPAAAAAPPFPVHLRVNVSQEAGPWRPIWRFFGADEPNYAAMKNGRKLLGELGQLAPGNVYFRAHNLLNSGDGTPALKWGSTGVYGEGARGEPVYIWTILDRIFDAYRESGVRPYFEVGFMPEALSQKPQPYQHHWTPHSNYKEIFTGWAYPPRDDAKWSDLVYAVAKHFRERYGAAETASWFWETWNEPNIGYWQGTPAEFFKLHDYTVAAIRRALPQARVGGPDVAGAGGRFMREFLEHCLRGTNYATGKIGAPLDFVSFHAKGAPRFFRGRVEMGIAAQLRTVDDAFSLIRSYPELAGIPVVIGECDPEGCAACTGPQLGYRNGTMYSSYTAASFARILDLAQQREINLEGALTWAFEFENQPLFAGRRSLASHGIDKPVLNVFRMYSKMRGQRLPVASDAAAPLSEVLRQGVRQKPEVSGLAARDGNQVALLLWHYHDDDLPGPAAAVELELNHLPPRAGDLGIRRFQIDRTHSNAYAAWQRMGAPPSPSPEQYAQLEKSGRLAELTEPLTITDEGSVVRLEFELPRQAVALILLSWRL